MTTATVEGRVEQAEDFDPFQYFEGGREGVRKRFGEIFIKELETLSHEEIMHLCEAAPLNPQKLHRLARGDYEVVDSQMIEHLSTSFKYDTRNGFGRPNIPPEEKSKLVGMANRKGFYMMPEDASTNDRLELYLIVEALRRLDSD